MEAALEFESLTLFLAVARHGSFTRASIDLNIAQSTISRRVQQLEECLGTRLLYRHGRGVALTEAGDRLAGVARQIFEQLDVVREELAGDANFIQGGVTLGLPPSLGASISVSLAKRFGSKFPKAHLRVVEAFSGSLLEMLEAGKLDVAVLYDARLSATLLVAPLFREDLYLIEGGRTGNGAAVDLATLGSGPFVLSHSSNGLRRVLDDAAAGAQVRMQISFELDSLTALKRAAEAGPERCVLPFGAVETEVREGKLSARPFAGDGLSALLVSATPLHRSVRRITQELNSLLVEQIGSSLAQGTLTGKLLQRPSSTTRAVPGPSSL